MNIEVSPRECCSLPEDTGLVKVKEKTISVSGKLFGLVRH